VFCVYIRLFAAKTVIFVVMLVVNRPSGLLRPVLYPLSEKYADFTCKKTQDSSTELPTDWQEKLRNLLILFKVNSLVSLPRA
jgi:hypothetical protein